MSFTMSMQRVDKPRRAVPAGAGFLSAAAGPDAAVASGAAQGQSDRGGNPSPLHQQTREQRVAMLRRGLRRMRTIATLLLVLMTLIFVWTAVTHYNWPWIPYVRAFTEAGMVGA